MQHVGWLIIMQVWARLLCIYIFLYLYRVLNNIFPQILLWLKISMVAMKQIFLSQYTWQERLLPKREGCYWTITCSVCIPNIHMISRLDMLVYKARQNQRDCMHNKIWLRSATAASRSGVLHEMWRARWWAIRAAIRTGRGRAEKRCRYWGGLEATCGGYRGGGWERTPRSCRICPISYAVTARMPCWASLLG